MEWQRLNNNCYLLRGSVNIGMVQTAKGFVAIDTGLDKQSAKKMLKMAEEHHQPMISIINTHAHADHFGGNATILAQKDIPIYAPKYEADVIRRPRYEPEYLWQGAKPLPQLINKFLQAAASPVTYEFEMEEEWTVSDTLFKAIGLPGHSIYQCGILVNDVLFAADAYFGVEITKKHGIPYMVDYLQTLSSAERVLKMDAKWYVPGHGDPINLRPVEAVEFLCARHQTVYEWIIRAVANNQAMTVEHLFTEVCHTFAQQPTNLGSYMLLQTSFHAYLTQAVEAHFLEVQVENGVLWVISK